MTSSIATARANRPRIRRALVASFAAERRGLLAGLAGRFIAPGQGNDPIRSPEALPTGRNFHALDGGQLPTRTAYELGVSLADRTPPASTEGEAESVILWASDTVRDEGTMIAFGLHRLGIRPVWSPRGVLQGLAREDASRRRDIVWVTSGLFRDLYPNLLVWLDRAALLALDASSRTVEEARPDLRAALSAALAPLGALRSPGDEPLASNYVARHWVEAADAALARGVAPEVAGREASLRVFGNAPGGYSAGINRLAERSGAFRDRAELARVFVSRMGHAYGIDRHGEPVHDAFRGALERTGRAYFGRASHLYGLLDNNDGFDYLGGLSLAIEHARGSTPESFVIRHADARDAEIESLASGLTRELRGRHLNPHALRALMEHGYAGARTMSTGFVENLWGWQLTNPEVVEPWIWDEVHAVFVEDKHGLGLDRFLDEGANVHVKTNILAILLVAA
ncbi:MAG: cobaltochelatase subunit CobN, partial [Polyangiaceae bacterium]|nr:cobaltochelatase subunit CobN [Polyangiaceae bacterium]